MEYLYITFIQYLTQGNILLQLFQLLSEMTEGNTNRRKKPPHSLNLCGPPFQTCRTSCTLRETSQDTKSCSAREAGTSSPPRAKQHHRLKGKGKDNLGIQISGQKLSQLGFRAELVHKVHLHCNPKPMDSGPTFGTVPLNCLLTNYVTILEPQ